MNEGEGEKEVTENGESSRGSSGEGRGSRKEGRREQRETP